MKGIVPFLLIIISSLATIGVCFWVSENVLFDVMLYQRSWLHGYTFNYAWDRDALARSGHIKQVFVRQRNHDLLELAAQKNTPTYTQACHNPRTSPGRLSFTKKHPLKVAIIGDSNAYGMGVLPQQRLGDKLEKKLNRFLPTKIWTLAEPGNSIEDYLALYQLAQDYFDPDIFLISMIDNDFLFNADFRYEDVSRSTRLLQSGCGTPEFAHYHLKKSWRDNILLNYPLTISSSDNYCYANKLIGKLAPEKTLFFRYLSAPSTQLCESNSTEENCLYGAIISSYTELVSQNGMTTIDAPTFSQSTQVSELEGHPSAKHHEELANHLARVVLNKITQQKSEKCAKQDSNL